MKRYEQTTYDFKDDQDDAFLTTSHGGHNNSITIHNSDPFNAVHLEITQGQAEDLMGKLQKAIINLEVHKKTLEA